MKTTPVSLLAVVLLGWGGYGLFWVVDEAAQAVPANQQHYNQQSMAEVEPQHQVLADTVIEQALQADMPPLEVLEQLPRSLKGTPAPEPLAMDADGKLVIDAAIRRTFDFYLTAIGEEPLDLMVARIKHHLAKSLSGQALEQVLGILQDYLDFRNQVAVLMQAHGSSMSKDLEAAALLKAQIGQLRQSIFEPAVDEAFFARQDEYDRYWQTRQQLAANRQLSDEERQDALAVIEAGAPSWLVAQEQADNKINDFHQQASTLARQGDRQSLQALAERQFGADAADRLMKLQQQRQHWREKLAVYHNQLLLLKGDNGWSEVGSQQVGDLREQHFSAAQIRRVAAIDNARFGIN